MKFIHVVLILYFSLSLTSAFSWFNARANHPQKQVTNTVNTHRSTSRPQQTVFQPQNRLSNGVSPRRQAYIAYHEVNKNYSPLQRALSQRQSHFRNVTTATRRPTGNSNRQNTQIIHQNRFNGIAYRQQNQARNNPATLRQADHFVTRANNRTVSPRFRSVLRSSRNNLAGVSSAGRRAFSPRSSSKSTLASVKPKTPLNPNRNTQPFGFRSALAKGNMRSTRTGPLHRAFTTKATRINDSQNHRSIPSNFYYQQRLKAFHNGASTRSKMSSSLKQKQRRNDPRSGTPNSMVFVRDSPQKEKNIDPYQRRI